MGLDVGAIPDLRGDEEGLSIPFHEGGVDVDAEEMRMKVLASNSSRIGGSEAGRVAGG